MQSFHNYDFTVSFYNATAERAADLKGQEQVSGVPCSWGVKTLRRFRLKSHSIH